MVFACLLSASAGAIIGALFMACVACGAQSDMADQHAAERRKWDAYALERARLIHGGRHDA